jgi:hypothetical protein
MTEIAAIVASLVAGFIGAALGGAYQAGKWAAKIEGLDDRTKKLEEQHSIQSAHGRAIG